MKKVAIALAVLALSACGDNKDREYVPQQTQAPAQQAPVAVQPAPQQVVVQQAPQQDHTATNMLVGGMVGYLMGRNSSPAPQVQSQPQQVVVHKTIVNKTVVKETPKPAPTPTPTPAKPSVQPAQTFKPTNTGYSHSSSSSNPSSSYKRK